MWAAVDLVLLCDRSLKDLSIGWTKHSHTDMGQGDAEEQFWAGSKPSHELLPGPRKGPHD